MKKALGVFLFLLPLIIITVGMIADIGLIESMKVLGAIGFIFVCGFGGFHLMTDDSE